VGRYHSRFGGLWLDRKNAPRELDRRVRKGLVSTQDAPLLENWISNGFLVLKNAVTPQMVDDLNQAIVRVMEAEDQRFLATVAGYKGDQPTRLERRFVDLPSVKLVDAYYYLHEARAILLAEPITRILDVLFEEPPMLFQSLSFVKGSEQWLHQDSTYVKVSPPVNLAASWTALQDVEQGSGELVYVPGSHRISEYLFSGKHKNWYEARDGSQDHADWVAHIDQEIAARGLKVEAFRPNKGDVFIWHSELVHGGKAIENDDLTRRSIVGHYCPRSCAPEVLWETPGVPTRHRVRPDDERVYAAASSFFVSSYYPGCTPSLSN
jgi:phytanoyl-CoA hydroxylase